MHFSVLLIHESDENFIMAKRNYDATKEDGADIEFQCELTEKQAKAEYNKAIKKDASLLEQYPDFKSYMEDEYSHLDLENGEYGTHSNADGMYDWYEIGGRWSRILPSGKSEKQLKDIVKKALDLTKKEVKEKYRDKVEEYVKISEMPVREACDYLQLDGQNEIMISDDISAQDIINKFKAIEKNWNEDFKKADAIHSMINTMIIQEEGDEEVYHEGDDRINEEFFIEKYNYFLELNKKEARGFKITILDCHT